MEPVVMFFATDVARQSGASYAMLETVKRLADRGARPLVVIPNSEDSRSLFGQDGCEVIYLNLKRVRRTLNPSVQIPFWLSFWPTVFRLVRIIRSRHVNIVHINEITDLMGGIAARLGRVPCVAHVRADGIPNPYRAALARGLDACADHVVVPSRSTEEWLSDARPSLTRKISLIYDYAFDQNAYDPSLPRQAVRAELGIPLQSRVVMLVSKLLRDKGHEVFIQAAGEVAKRRSDVLFVIVGDEVDGHEEDAAVIRSLAKPLVEAGILHMAGARSDLPLCYAAADVAVHCPIYPDPYPTVVLLGMLMRKPVIGSAIGGIPEQICDGQTGLLVPPNDPRATANAILELLADPDRAAQLARNGEAWCRRSCSPEPQASALMDIYRRLLQKRR